MEPLEDLLAFAKAAEHRAKNPTKEDVRRRQVSRNGLASQSILEAGQPLPCAITGPESIPPVSSPWIGDCSSGRNYTGESSPHQGGL